MGFFTMQRREVLKLFLVAPMAAAAQYGLRPVSALSVRGVDRLVPKQGTLQIFSGVMPATPAIVGLDNVLIAEAPFSDGDETELIAQVTGTATYMRVLDEGGFGIIQGPIKWAGSSAINMANVINLKVSICNDI